MEAEKVLADWAEQVRLKTMEMKAAVDPTWGDTEEAQEHLRDVFAAFGGPQHNKMAGADS